jgi:hypothetical protein
MQKAVAAVASIREAKRRINIDTKKTFYSVNDSWHYIALVDDRTCLQCLDKDGVEFTGMYLRTFLPYHTIDNEDTIRANKHPNCRCILLRSSLFFSSPEVEEP